MVRNLLCILLLMFLGSDPVFTSSTERGIAGKEHYVRRDGIRIYLWEKYRKGSEAEVSRTGKVVLLVHGATWSGRPDFDLQIRDYSLMDFLAKNDYDVWAIDIHGYGHSDKVAGDFSDTDSAARDIGAAVEYIAQLRKVQKISLLGWSWGSQTSGLYTMRHPERIRRLILYGMLWKGNPEWRKLPLPKEQYRINTEANAREDFVEGQFEPDVVEKYVKEALATDPKTPNGVRIDIRTKLPMLTPEQIKVPTLIIKAENDRSISEEDALEFLRKLATNYKSYIALPDGGHAILLERNHDKFQTAVLTFLNQP